jgi:hypothetical protein
MNNDAKSKRLDKIELQLTPKQWAIRLADEIRRYASQEDFMKAIGKGTFRQSPFVKPFFVLAQQVQERWPARSTENIKRTEKLYRKLQMEFQALKLLINNINEAISIKAETNRLKAALQLSKLQTLILKDSLAYTGVIETTSAIRARLHLLSDLEEWADDSAILLMQTTPCKTAVQTIQEDYFDGHPFLYKDTETALEIATRTVRDAIAVFNEYVTVRGKLSNPDSDPEQQKSATANDLLVERESSLPIDIEAVEKRTEFLVDIIAQQWVKEAKYTANAEVLRETGRHEDFVWGNFQRSWA